MKLKKLLILALVSFIFVSFAQNIAYALPSEMDGQRFDAVVTGDTDVMTINSKQNCNVLNWQSFDIKENETVVFDDGNNYLNIVHDSNPTQISGKLTGNGNIYIINPNGVIFDSSSSVNVGNLYVSTRQISSSDIESFTSGDNLFAPPSGDINGDVFNLGKTVAKSVFLEGKNVTLTDNIEGKINVYGFGAKVGFVCSSGTGNVNNIQFAQGNALTDLLNDFTKKNNVQFNDFERKSITPDLYWVVRNVCELQNMQNNPTANYMLINDIDAQDTRNWNNNLGFTPIGINGSSFSGTFCGMGFQLKNLYINFSGVDVKKLASDIGDKIINVDMPNINVQSDSLSNMFHTDNKLYVTSLENSLLYIAGYDSSKSLVSLKIYEIPAGAVNSEYDFSDGEKAFLWDSNMLPLCKSELNQ